MRIRVRGSGDSRGALAVFRNSSAKASRDGGSAQEALRTGLPRNPGQRGGRCAPSRRARAVANIHIRILLRGMGGDARVAKARLSSGGLDCRSAFASYNIGIIRVAVVCVAAQVPARPARRPREKAAALWRNRGRVGMPRMAEGAYVYGVPVAAARAFAVAQARGNPDGRIRWGMDCIVHRHIFQPRRRGIHMAPLCAAEIQYITQLFRAPAVR